MAVLTSQRECGEKHLAGASLKLLMLVQEKGLEADSLRRNEAWHEEDRKTRNPIPQLNRAPMAPRPAMRPICGAWRTFCGAAWMRSPNTSSRRFNVSDARLSTPGGYYVQPTVGHGAEAPPAHVVLRLIFLKYISEAFEERHARLEGERAQGADPGGPRRVPRREHLLGAARGPLGAAQDAGEATDDRPAQFASAEGKKGGEFYTPRCVVKLPGPDAGSLSGPGLRPLLRLIRHVRAIGRVHPCACHRQRQWWESAQGYQGRHLDLGPGVQLHDLAARQDDWGGERLTDDKRWQYGTPPKGNANFAWVQHMVHHLAPNGVAGFVLANGSMSSNQSGEGQIRESLIEKDLVDRTHRELTDEDIARIADTYHAWRGGEGTGEYADVPPVSARARRWRKCASTAMSSPPAAMSVPKCKRTTVSPSRKR